MCKYKDKCPSASGWCNTKDFSDDCFDFLESVGKHLQGYIDTGYSAEEVIELNTERKNIQRRYVKLYDEYLKLKGENRNLKERLGDNI